MEPNPIYVSTPSITECPNEPSLDNMFRIHQRLFLIQKYYNIVFRFLENNKDEIETIIDSTVGRDEKEVLDKFLETFKNINTDMKLYNNYTNELYKKYCGFPFLKILC